MQTFVSYDHLPTASATTYSAWKIRLRRLPTPNIAACSLRDGLARLRGRRSALDLILSHGNVRMSETHRRASGSPLASAMIIQTVSTRMVKVRLRRCPRRFPAVAHSSGIHRGGILGHTARKDCVDPPCVPKYSARRSPRDRPRHEADKGPSSRCEAATSGSSLAGGAPDKPQTVSTSC